MTENEKKQRREVLNARARELYKENRERILARNRKTYHAKREHYSSMRMASRLRRKYGMTVSDFNQMMTSQNGACPVCGIKLERLKQFGWSSENNLACVDHCHKTGRVRGILCRRCNLSVSYIEDNNLVQKVEAYLKTSEVSDKEQTR